MRASDFFLGALVLAEMGVTGPGFGVGHSLHPEAHPAPSCFSELMAKLEKHKAEEEEEEEQQHSEHGEDPQ